jgi:major membrane immunogen (membrane-anchored lipoprotein)
MRFRAVGLLTMIGVVLLSGCGTDDGLGKRYRVSGTITYKGQPLEKGTISFYPTTPDPKGINNGANSTIVNGRYSLSTLGDEDGAFPGDYLVSIESKDVDFKKAESNVQGGVFKQDDVAKAYRSAKNLIPDKYSNYDTSGFTAKVKESSNTFDFELVD